MIASILIIALGVGPLRGGTDSPPAGQTHAGGPIILKPVTVTAKPLGSYGLSVRVKWNSETAMVESILIDQVLPDSPAARAGLGTLTTIRKIDGRPVQEFVATFDNGSDLNRALVNRKPGDRITLEVLDVGATRPRMVTLVESAAASRNPRVDSKPFGY